MVGVPTEDGIILFGIGNSIGNDQIRLFFEMAALKREIEKEYLLAYNGLSSTASNGSLSNRVICFPIQPGIC